MLDGPDVQHEEEESEHSSERDDIQDGSWKND
jgi:hypothetical protein